MRYLWDILGAICINVAYLEVKSTDVRQVVNMRETMTQTQVAQSLGYLCLYC